MEFIENKLSYLGKNLQGSEIRRLFAISAKQGVISFAGGLPDPGSFPAQQVKEYTKKLMDERGAQLLQYSGSRGSADAFDAVKYLLKRRDIAVQDNEIIMTAGAQQAINLMTQIFIEPGEVILTENPTFIGALGVFRNAQAKLVGIDMDDNGLVPEQLEEKLKEYGDKVKFLYTIPNFQNPAAVTMSLERREQVYKLAQKYDILILEDDPYGELWFEGRLESVKPIKALDTDNRVVYTGSFSKVLSPGIRLGYAVAPNYIIDKFDMARQMIDVCPNPLMQAIAGEMARTNYFDEHITNLRSVYAKRCNAMLAALDEYMPKSVSWTKPKGGFYIWVTLPEHLNSLDLLHVALENQVAFVIGSASTPDGSGQNCLRISFCHENEETIVTGVKRLGSAVHDFLIKTEG